jgi:hypothetical protein
MNTRSFLFSVSSALGLLLVVVWVVSAHRAESPARFPRDVGARTGAQVYAPAVVLVGLKSGVTLVTSAQANRAIVPLPPRLNLLSLHSTSVLLKLFSLSLKILSRATPHLTRKAPKLSPRSHASIACICRRRVM